MWGFVGSPDRFALAARRTLCCHFIMQVVRPRWRAVVGALGLYVLGCGSGASHGSTTPAGGLGGSAASSGGNTAAGGADGGAPAHVVGTCDKLGAVNQFENITPAGVSAALRVVVDPVHSGTVFVGTDKTGIYKSTDCGAEWTKVNTGANAAVIDSGQQWSMEIDPAFPDVLYAGSLYGSDVSLFKSTNGGQDWTSLFPAGGNVATAVQYSFLQEVSIDPDKARHQHLVVSFHADCMGDFGKMCLGESTDGGQTWRLFKGPTAAWVENARPIVLGEKSFLYVTVEDGVFYTGDSGATWENVASGGNHQVYVTSDGTHYLGSVYGMFQSPDGHTWTKLDASPDGDGMSGDGQRVFTGLRDSGADQQPYFTTPEQGGGTWTKFASPPMANGPVTLRYDSDHHLLYSANTTSGLWRVVTQ